MQANKLLADQSRKSTNNMESLTHDMRKVAHKTKSETVSMKIITLVTLFFLPGTFISVGCLFVYLVSCLPRPSAPPSTRKPSYATELIEREHTDVSVDSHEHRHSSLDPNQRHFLKSLPIRRFASLSRSKRTVDASPLRRLVRFRLD